MCWGSSSVAENTWYVDATDAHDPATTAANTAARSRRSSIETRRWSLCRCGVMGAVE